MHAEQIAQRYFENLIDFESNLAWFESFIDVNISIKVIVSIHGTIREIDYEGIIGFEEYRREFYNSGLKSIKGENTPTQKFFSSDNEVVIWHEKPCLCGFRFPSRRFIRDDKAFVFRQGVCARWKTE